jgi:hypothetical protein
MDAPEVQMETPIFAHQPENRPISQEQLLEDVKGIYAGLLMVKIKAHTGRHRTEGWLESTKVMEITVKVVIYAQHRIDCIA